MVGGRDCSTRARKVLVNFKPKFQRLFDAPYMRKPLIINKMRAKWPVFFVPFTGDTFLGSRQSDIQQAKSLALLWVGLRRALEPRGVLAFPNATGVDA